MKSLLVSGGNPAATTAGATQYWILATAGLSASTTEANRQIVYTSAGTLSKLYVRVTANTTSIASTLFVRKNTANATLNVTIGIATTGVFEDTSNTDTVAAADKLNYRTVSGGTGTMSIGIVSTVFTPTTSTDTVSRLTAGPPSSAYTVDSTSRYAQLVGQISGATSTESQAQTRITKAGTLKNLAVYVSGNARVTDTTLRIRLNGANTSILITVAAGVTGFVEDSTHSEAVAVGDLVNFGVDTSTGAAQALTVQTFSIDFVSTQGQGITSTGAATALTQAANVTNYFPLGGNIAAGTTEADRKTKSRETLIFSGLTISITTNTVSDPSTLMLRKNGVDSALSAIIAASTTGQFDNLATLEECHDNDEVNFALTTGVSGTSLVMRHMAIAHKHFTAAIKTITDPTTTISETRARQKAVERLQP